jgi:hypothetical protein
MQTPSLHIIASTSGVEEVEVFYRPSQRAEAWQLCLKYLPPLLALPDTNNPRGECPPQAERNPK